MKNQGEGSECPASEVLVKREPSPELARISALITRPPKQKSASKTTQPKQENVSELVASPTISNPPPTPGAGSVVSPVPTSGSSPVLAKTKKGVTKPIQKVKGKELIKKAGMTTETEPTKEPVAFYYDSDGNKVWICPACGGQDDGSPMIGCDDCDAWYHWVCVGIQVPPDENEDWYCRVCIVKKQENIADKKKKSRKKKILT
ncbi:hypothetical protein B7P43_G09094 [Cryptotermes secundus]|nr:hypothetical protein B7P43_G09094 [Cryptotermes secundus]